MTVRLNLSVDEGIPDLLTKLAGGDRKRGEYISELVRQVDEGRGAGQLKEERLQAQIDGLLVKMTKIEARITELEQIARSGF